MGKRAGKAASASNPKRARQDTWVGRMERALAPSTQPQLNASHEFTPPLEVVKPEPLSLRSYSVDEDQHPCHLVNEHFGPTADGRILDLVNHWLKMHGHAEAHVQHNSGAKCKPETIPLHPHLIPEVMVGNSCFPNEGIPTTMPLMALYLPVPVDKAPPLVTWSKFATSIWTQWEPHREPLEIKALSNDPMKPGDVLKPFTVGVCRGYSRATILAFAICQTLVVEDPATLSQEEQDEFTRPGHLKQVGIGTSRGRADSDLVPVEPDQIV